MKGIPTDQAMEIDPAKPAATVPDPSIEVDSRWMHMDKVEHEKLEWMKDLPQPSVQRTTDDSVWRMNELRLPSFTRIINVYFGCRIQTVFPLVSISRVIWLPAQPIYRWQPLFIITAKNRMQLGTLWMSCFISLVLPFFSNVSLLCKHYRISFVKWVVLSSSSYQSIDLN